MQGNGDRLHHNFGGRGLFQLQSGGLLGGADTIITQLQGGNRIKNIETILKICHSIRPQFEILLNLLKKTKTL